MSKKNKFKRRYGKQLAEAIPGYVRNHIGNDVGLILVPLPKGILSFKINASRLIPFCLKHHEELIRLCVEEKG